MSVKLTRFMIGLWAMLVAGGWLLSSVHALNRAGYVFLFGAVAIFAVPRWWRVRTSFRFHLRRWRWRKWLPLGYAVLLGAVLLGGWLYWPNNYDALTYRQPRVLHWLAHGQWHWIHTDFGRLNTRAPDCEWAMAPFFLFFRSERWVWLLNGSCLVALPGLIYAAFTRAGVSPRTAWRWMWLLPTGYCFLLQAGGDANDFPGAFFALAALALALRARRGGGAADLHWSILALALATGVKVSNAPLALPWLIAAWPARGLLLRRPVLTAATAVLAALCSFLPGAAMNYRHSGDWSGQKVEGGGVMPQNSPRLSAVSNAIRLTIQNFNPPVFPMASKWNAAAPALLPESLRRELEKTVEQGNDVMTAVEMPLEDNAGLGPLLALLLAGSAAGSLRARRSRPAGAWDYALRVSPLISLGVFSVMMNLAAAGRLAAPYYLFLPLAWLPGRSARPRAGLRLWKAGAALHMATALLVLIITPARPLWPALTVLGHLPARLQASPLVTRARAVYANFRVRADVLAPVREALPVGEKVGLVVYIEAEASLWRPYGSRKFEQVLPSDDPQAVIDAGFHYLALSKRPPPRGTTPEPAGTIPPELAGWLAAMGAETVASVTVQPLISLEPNEWLILRLGKVASP